MVENSAAEPPRCLSQQSRARVAGSKSKSIIVSFQGDPSEKPKWLQLWCSAVEAANLDPALAQFRHESLADKFNNEYSEKVRPNPNPNPSPSPNPDPS